MFFKKKRELVIQDNAVSVMDVNGEDYICLTDMIKSKDGEFFVKDWLRNRNTLEFLAVWEQMHNPDFNRDGFAPLATVSVRIPVNILPYIMTILKEYEQVSRTQKDDISGNSI